MLHVAYCFDKNYRQHFGAAVTSLLSNGGHAGREMVVHVISDEFDEALTSKLVALRSRFQVTIKEYPLDGDQLAKINALAHDPITKYLSHAAYYRMWLVELLPADVSRVLYLDSDTIVQKPIAELYDLPLDGYAAAGAENINKKKWLSVHNIDLYLNSGVLLLNLDYWRQHQSLARCLQWLEENPGKNYLGDQCVINAALAGSLKAVEPHWNHYVTPGRPLETIAEAPILHYITGKKPWQAWYETERAKPYWQYLNQSPWRGASAEPPRTVAELYKLAQLYHTGGDLPRAVAAYRRVIELQARAIKQLTASR